jgi:Ca2+-binding RTX toxin-like protein
VTVNHNHPSGGPTACADLRRILVFAGEGPDRVSLGDVTTTAFDRLMATSVSGQLGDDALIGSEIGDDLIGGGGVDSLRGGKGRDHLTPGPGGGEAIGGEGRDAVSVAGDGDWKINDARAWLVQADEITTLGSIEFAAVTGGPGSNLISGGSFTGNLRLKGRGGGDLLQAGEGDDLILGGDGNDFVQAGSGDDELEGGTGDDSLGGESGNDELSGGGGDDTCRGGPGADSFASC